MLVSLPTNAISLRVGGMGIDKVTAFGVLEARAFWFIVTVDATVFTAVTNAKFGIFVPVTVWPTKMLLVDDTSMIALPDTVVAVGVAKDVETSGKVIGSRF